MESDVTVARQFQSFIATIAEQRAIAHAESCLADVRGEQPLARNYSHMEYVFIDTIQRALAYALEPQRNRTFTLDQIGLDMFAQFGANEVLTQIQFFDQNNLTEASQRAWLIVFIEWARCASGPQYSDVRAIREVGKAKELVKSMGVSSLLYIS